ncbi:MAG: helix-turn-helix domain-containing protein [Betaproteobacteria bacterium]|nr:helix-turn-helix domain-containing protein [Betaproteobacteria bacterium]
MPSPGHLNTSLERQLLLQLGDRLRQARRARGLSSAALAKQVGISRTTLSAVEAGEPAPTMGTYLRVLSCLGLAGDLALVGSDAVRQTNDRSRHTPIVVSTGSNRHAAQDLQSMMLHREAVALIRKNPEELVARAFKTLERWQARGPSASQPLWDEWKVILHRQDWKKVLLKTRRAQELRQASPIVTMLPEETRLRILREVRELKAGVNLSIHESAAAEA